MGLFDKFKKTIDNNNKTEPKKEENDYVEKYSKYVLAGLSSEITYDSDKYPDGTELIQQFTEDLNSEVKNNNKDAVDYLVTSLLSSTIGTERFKILKNIFGNNLGKFVTDIEPKSFAIEGHPLRKLILMEGFVNWGNSSFGKPSPNDFNTLLECYATILKTYMDDSYLLTSDAYIWSIIPYKLDNSPDITKRDVLDSAKEYYENKNSEQAKDDQQEPKEPEALPKTLKEIVKTDPSLLEKGEKLLSSDNEYFKENCQQVVQEILKYRNEQIENYISSVLNRFPSEEAIEVSVPFTFYYADENTFDELGKLVMKIMDKSISV